MLSLALALLLTGGPQTTSIASVEGKVFDGMTSLPVTRARVILVRADRPKEQVRFGITDNEPSTESEDPKATRMATVTGADGTFRFRVEAPARFVLYADAAGYVKTPSEVSPSSIHTAKPGSAISDIAIWLSPSLSISGRVLDADTGEPVRNLHVEAQRYRRTKSGRILIPDAWTNTDDQGRFKISGVSSGEFYVQVSAGRDAAIGPPKPVEDFRSVVVRDYVPVWHPGTERIEKSLPVIVPIGVDVRDIEIKLTRKRVAVLRGRVLGAETAGAEGTVMLSLIGVRGGFQRGGYTILVREQLKTGPEFEIERVPPGAYYLSAETDSLAAVLPLYVSDENQDKLDLYLRSGVTLTGRVQMEGRAKRADEPALPSQGVQVGLTPLARMRMRDPGSGVVDSVDGSFTVEGAMVDRYHVYVAKPPKGYRVSEVRYNGSPCPSGIVVLDAGTNAHRLDITLALASGSIAATTKDGIKPVPAATVVVIPEPVEDDAIDGGFDVHHTEADGDGRATVSGLLPGTYRVTAYPPNSFWGDDSHLKQQLREGKRVQVAANQVTLVELPIRSAGTSAVSLK
jgi:hypothetical protein